MKKDRVQQVSGREFGFVVDAVTEVIRLDGTAIEAATGIAQSNEFIKSIGKVDKRLVIILDLDKIFNQEEMIMMRYAG